MSDDNRPFSEPEIIQIVSATSDWDAIYDDEAGKQQRCAVAVWALVVWEDGKKTIEGWVNNGDQGLISAEKIVYFVGYARVKSS